MGNLYPTQLNNFVTSSSSGKLGDVGHAASHNALEAKVGIDGSAVATSLDYLAKAASNPGHTHTLEDGATDVTATAAELNYVSGVTSAIQTQLDAKAPIASPTFTGTVSGITKSMVGLGNVDNTSDSTKNSATATLTNKRITKRISTITSSATPTPNVDNCDIFTISAIAEAATFGAPTGTPTDGQSLVIRIDAATTPRALDFNAAYRFSTDLPKPTTTVTGKVLYMGFIYNSIDSKYDCLAILNNF